MTLAQTILNAALPNHLLAVLKQTIADIGALDTKRRELVQQIADATAVFKVGDTIIGDKGRPMLIERIVGKEQHSWDDNKLPEIEVFYAGRFILKDGSLGKDVKDTQWDYVLGRKLRIARPNEITQPKAKPQKKTKLRAPGLDDGESPFHPIPGVHSAGEY